MEAAKSVPRHTIKKTTEEGFAPDTIWKEPIKKNYSEYKNLIVCEKSEENKASTDEYFESYAHYGIHEEMLKDSHRTNSYRLAIERNPHLFKDKIVLDVGCGTGILSIFAVRAGAKHVYAVDCSDIIMKACEISRVNGYDDKITFVKGKVEDIELPVERVDIIISEWMGYFLLYESMMDSVLFARDMWLREGGLIFPDKAVLYVAGIEDYQYKKDKLECWNDMYDVNMSMIRDSSLREPTVDVINSNQVCTDACSIFEVDLLTATVNDLEFSNFYSVTATRNDYMHGIVAWFDVKFTQIHKPMIMTTTPYEQDTHWKQTIFYFEGAIKMQKGEKTNGSIAVKKNDENPRHLDIKVSYRYKGRNHHFHRVHQYKY